MFINTFIENYYFTDRVNQSFEHLIHNENCGNLPLKYRKTFIGSFPNRKKALSAAYKHYPSEKFVFCKKCCR